MADEDSGASIDWLAGDIRAGRGHQSHETRDPSEFSGTIRNLGNGVFFVSNGRGEMRRDLIMAMGRAIEQAVPSVRRVEFERADGRRFALERGERGYRIIKV